MDNTFSKEHEYKAGFTELLNFRALNNKFTMEPELHARMTEPPKLPYTANLLYSHKSSSQF